MKKVFFLFVLFSLTIANVPLFSQAFGDYSTGVSKKDTVCFKYKFFPGDTLEYYVTAHDSIIIDYDDALMRIRYERWRLVCDSVSQDGLYYLSYTLMEYLAKERKGDIEPVTRKTSPWTGRTAKILLDSLGRRYISHQEDETKAAMSPGGAYTPHLLIKINESCKAVNESWIVKSEGKIVENGFPYPEIDRSMLMRAKESRDTLGYDCNRLNYISTASGTVSVVTDMAKVRVEGVLNGFGDMSISKKEWVPVFYHGSLEQKLKIDTPDNPTKPGWQYVDIYYSLSRFLPSEKRKEYHEKMRKAREKAKEEELKQKDGD
jgi:hypothetical protein